jgi:hypothetical protein
MYSTTGSTCFTSSKLDPPGHIRAEIAKISEENSHINNSLQDIRNAASLPMPSRLRIEDSKSWFTASMLVGGGLFPGADATSVSEPFLPGPGPIVTYRPGAFAKPLIFMGAAAAATSCAWLVKRAVIGESIDPIPLRSQATFSSNTCPSDNQVLLNMLPKDLRQKIKTEESRAGSVEERIEGIASLLQKSQKVEGVSSLLNMCEPEASEPGGKSVQPMNGIHHLKREAGVKKIQLILQSSKRLVDEFESGAGRISSIEAVIEDWKSSEKLKGISVEDAMKLVKSMGWIRDSVITPHINRISGRIDRTNNMEEQVGIPLIPQLEILRQGITRAALRLELSKLQHVFSGINEMIAALNRVQLDAIG